MVARIGTFGRPRRWPTVIITVIVVIGVVMVILSRFYVDLLWYREVGRASCRERVCSVV